VIGFAWFDSNGFTDGLAAMTFCHSNLLNAFVLHVVRTPDTLPFIWCSHDVLLSPLRLIRVSNTLRRSCRERFSLPPQYQKSRRGGKFFECQIGGKTYHVFFHL
jgi:hypothetical protein